MHNPPIARQRASQRRDALAALLPLSTLLPRLYPTSGRSSRTENGKPGARLPAGPRPDQAPCAAPQRWRSASSRPARPRRPRRPQRRRCGPGARCGAGGAAARPTPPRPACRGRQAPRGPLCSLPARRSRAARRSPACPAPPSRVQRGALGGGVLRGGPATSGKRGGSAESGPCCAGGLACRVFLSKK